MDQANEDLAQELAELKDSANSEKQAREKQVTALNETVQNLQKKLKEVEEENRQRPPETQVAKAETSSSASEPEREVNGSDHHDSLKQELEQLRATCNSQQSLLEQRDQEKEQQATAFSHLQTRFTSLEGDFERESRVRQEQAQRIGNYFFLLRHLDFFFFKQCFFFDATVA